MSILAGIFSRGRQHPIEPTACEELRRAISRDKSDTPTIFRDDLVFLLKVDIGAFGAKGDYVGPDGSCSMIAGAPFLRHDGDPTTSREYDLKLVHASLNMGASAILRRARGSFALAHYSPTSGTFTLATDKSGLRTVYYWETQHHVYFATALRIFVDSPLVPREMDLRAVSEIAVLGYPLADRTGYSGIRSLRAGEVIRFSASRTAKSQYWRWDEVAPGAASEEQLLKETYAQFTSAVKVRLAGDSVTRSALTGGMDSRCVVGMLRNLNVLVHTFTFMPRTSLDQVLASLVAHRLGTFHVAIDEGRQERWVSLSKRTWEESKARLRWPPERPQILWGGDGGGLLLGHIKMDAELVGLLRRDKDAAIDAYVRLNHNPLLRRLLNRDLYAELKDVAVRGIREEIEDCRTSDPAHAFYLFLIFNDQRRNLTGHFENVDVNRWELQAPFFDSDVMASIMSSPRDLYLRHQFYNKWLSLFPAVLSSVPWQAYPGHVPCPLSAPEGLDYQWGKKRAPEWREIETESKLKRLSQARAMLTDRAFASSLIRRPYLAIATLVYAVGLRNYDYVIDQAQTFHTYWLDCGGRLARTAPTAMSVP